jgi:hypothetical protein
LGGEGRGGATVASDMNGCPKEQEMNILNEKSNFFLRSRKFKLLNQIKGN